MFYSADISSSCPFCRSQYRVSHSFRRPGPDFEIDLKELAMDQADSHRRKAGMRKEGPNVVVPIMPNRNISREAGEVLFGSKIE